MKKYYAIFGILLCIMMGMNLKSKYENFVFHAYETTYKKGIYEGNLDEISVDSFVLVNQGSQYQAGSGYIHYSNLNLEGLEIDLIADDLKYVLDYAMVEEGTLRLGRVEPKSVEKLALRFIYPSTKESFVIDLNESVYTSYDCHVEDYAITDFYVKDHTVVLGYLNTKNYDLLEKHPNCIIEYDVVKDGNDVVFFAKTGLTKDFINSNHTFVEHVDFDLNEDPIKVIVSLSNEDDSYTFELLLNKVGEQ